MKSLYLNISNAIEAFNSNRIPPHKLLMILFCIGVCGVAIGLIIATFIYL